MKCDKRQAVDVVESGDETDDETVASLKEIVARGDDGDILLVSKEHVRSINALYRRALYEKDGIVCGIVIENYETIESN